VTSVSEIFDLKVADTHTHPQTFTSTDNKGRLKLSARESTVTKFVRVMPRILWPLFFLDTRD